jgi:DNA-binding beta-propeller fold protein YncE
MVAAAAAGRGEDRGFGSARVFRPPFSIPTGIAAAPDGSVLVAESGAHRFGRAVLAEPGATTTWRSFGEVADLDAAGALAVPQGVAVDAAGNAYVVDTHRQTVQRYRYDASSASYSRDPSFGPLALPPSDPRPISRPRDVAVGADGRIYLLDSGNDRILVADGPGARTWGLHRSDPSWDSPYGLDVGPDGTVYLADTGNHRIVVLRPGGPAETFGGWGDEGGRLRQPRDVAVGPDGDIFVADTLNHRIAVFAADHTLTRSLGGIPLLGQAERIDVDETGRILVSDSQNGWIVVWPGRSLAAAGTAAAPDADAFIRTAPWDNGTEPFGGAEANTSPDILVRARPDLDIARAERDGLRLVGDDPLVFERPNYLYFEIRNRGTEPVVDAALGVWHREVGGENTTFPDTWSHTGLFRRWRSPTDRVPGNLTEVGYVAPGGRTIAGPVVWYPRATGTSCDNRVDLMARLVHLADPTPELPFLEPVRESNNVALRTLLLVPASCVPLRDRYESNDSWGTRMTPAEGWSHLAARCPRWLTRETGERYPEAECPGVFENGRAPSPGRPAAPRAAEEIWNLLIPDLSLHGTTDRDFFEIALPHLQDPRWGLHDINPEEVRRLGRRDPGSYEPHSMPECGNVQRREFGPSGLDDTIWVNVSTELVVIAEPTANAVAMRPLGSRGEQVRIYRDGTLQGEESSGEVLVKRIVCPQEAEGLSDVEVSFGERFGSDGLFDPRPLEALGGYQLRLQYLSSIERGIPDWARDINEGRGIRSIPCLRGAFPFLGGGGPRGLPGVGGFLPGGSFPFCGDEWPGDLVTPRHPQTPGLPPCLADGPGCREYLSLRWPEIGNLGDLFFAAPSPLQVRLLDARGKEMARSSAFQGPAMELPPEIGKVAGLAGLQVQTLSTGRLKGGLYFLVIEGKPTVYLLGTRPQQKPPSLRR